MSRTRHTRGKGLAWMATREIGPYLAKVSFWKRVLRRRSRHAFKSHAREALLDVEADDGGGAR